MVVQLELWPETWKEQAKTIKPKKQRRGYTKQAVTQYEARQLRLIFLPRLYTPEEAWKHLGAKNRQEVYYWIRQYNGTKLHAIKVGSKWRIIPSWTKQEKRYTIS